MDFPEFPDSREVLLEDKPVFDSLFANDPPDISAYTFTNIFSWRRSYNTQVSRLGECVIVHYNRHGVRRCLMPLGGRCARPAIEQAFDRAKDAEMEFAYLPSRVAELFRGDPRYKLELDRDNWDYVYLASDLIDLPGRKFDAKRNFINRFKSQHKYEYVALSGNLTEECWKFAERWCDEKLCESVESLARERVAVYEMLTNFDALKLVGGAIRIEGQILAFSLGEALNPQTLVVHVEKADSSIDGLYQLINNEFCIHEAAGYTYVNREQDLGVPGLRKAKESYHPVRLVETWKLNKIM
ncbi:MAG: phosphatidylglycerol lysyltransferase domain-containing protein [Armatimonadetes bacterium]|nr:phosphatidylglycerol lysyltransferase domain-containing protein [Armatimonadota bacterium]